jgi:hypothetical protein
MRGWNSMEDWWRGKEMGLSSWEVEKENQSITKLLLVQETMRKPSYFTCHRGKKIWMIWWRMKEMCVGEEKREGREKLCQLRERKRIGSEIFLG